MTDVQTTPARAGALRLAVLLAAIILAAVGCSKTPADDVVAEARRLAALGDTASIDQAIVTLEPLVRRKQTPPSIVNYYLALHVLAHRELEVLALAETHAAAQPSDDQALYLLGKIYQANDRNEDALAPFKSAHDLNPEDLNILIATAYCAGRENDPEAGEYFRLLESRPDPQVKKAELYNEWGLWLAQQEGRTLDAIATLSKGYDPENPDPVLTLNIAIVYERFRPAVARDWYLRYKRLLPPNADAERHKMVQQKLRSLPE
jgi:tetratricopeptide (TPR) repeat protein